MKRIVTLSAVLALLVAAQAASAGPTGGPISGTTRVRANAVNTHVIEFRGGSVAEFEVIGDGDTTLNVEVIDSLGRVVGRTTGPGDHCRVSWIPSRTGTYRIRVINEGPVYNEYRYWAR